jgi:predicted DNA-binding protein
VLRVQFGFKTPDAVHLSSAMYDALMKLSGKRAQSVAGVSLSLIEEALEYQEDLHFSRIADDRLSRKQKRVSHEEAWD